MLFLKKNFINKSSRTQKTGKLGQLVLLCLNSSMTSTNLSPSTLKMFRVLASVYGADLEQIYCCNPGCDINRMKPQKRKPIRQSYFLHLRPSVLLLTLLLHSKLEKLGKQYRDVVVWLSFIESNKVEDNGNRKTYGPKLT